MKRRSKLQRRGFTLLEVMVAMAILAIALGAVFSAEAGSVRMAGRARKLGFASTLVRCKMGEIEEQIAKEGFPAAFDEGEDNCCKDAEIAGFTCKWEIEPVSMPDEMFEPKEGEDAEADGKDGADKDKTGKDSKSGSDSKTDTDKSDTKGKNSTDALKEAIGSVASSKGKKLDPAELLKDPKKLLGGGSTPGGAAMGMGAAVGMGSATGSGAGADDEGGPPDMDAIASMTMSYVYPILKPSFESQIRRATVTVMWNEGSAAKKFDVTQYLVAEQPIPIPGLDPNAQNTQGLGSQSTTGSTTGSGSGSTTGANTGSMFGTGSSNTGSSSPGRTSGGLFAPRTNFGFGTGSN